MTTTVGEANSPLAPLPKFNCNVPLLIVVVPEYVSVLVSTKVPDPDLIVPPEPEIVVPIVPALAFTVIAAADPAKLSVPPLPVSAYAWL